MSGVLQPSSGVFARMEEAMKIFTLVLCLWSIGGKAQKRPGRQLSPFAVVQFPNTDCVSNEGVSGEDILHYF